MRIEAGTAQPLFVHAEAQRMDQMQVGAGVGGETDDIAGVRRNLRFIEDDMQHG